MISALTSPKNGSPQTKRLDSPIDYGNGGGSFIHSYGSRTFIRPKLDNVLDAVAQAKFNEKDRKSVV